MITLNFEKAPAWVAFIVGIVVGFFVQPYVMEAFNNSLVFENQTLKNQIVQLEQRLSKSSEKFVQPPNPPTVQPEPSSAESYHWQTFNGVKIALSSCQKTEEAISVPRKSRIACQFIINKPIDFITIYAYGTLLKAQQNVVGNVDTVQTTGYNISVIKTEKDEISSWKLSASTTSAMPFTLYFWIPIDTVTIVSSVELFIKANKETTTTVKFTSINIE
jgi:hypothetical protein